MSKLPEPPPDGSRYFDRLTSRQREVVLFVYQGLTNEAISKRLRLSTKTIEKHRKAAMRNMKVTSVVMLIRLLCRELRETDLLSLETYSARGSLSCSD